MNPNILNKNPLMFFDRAVNAQRSQLLTVMADAVSECRTAAETGSIFPRTDSSREGCSVIRQRGSSTKVLS